MTQYEARAVQFDGVNWQAIGFYADTVYWFGTTADAAPTEIFLKGVASNRLVADAQTSACLNLTAIARDNDANKTKAWTINVVFQRNSTSTTALVGSVIYTVLAESGSGTATWDVVVSANDADETIRITVTGQAGRNISWTVTT
jgi:hypothetical protein